MTQRTLKWESRCRNRAHAVLTPQAESCNLIAFPALFRVPLHGSINASSLSY